jgi:hypothetical protein
MSITPLHHIAAACSLGESEGSVWAANGDWERWPFLEQLAKPQCDMNLETRLESTVGD